MTIQKQSELASHSASTSLPSTRVVTFTGGAAKARAFTKANMRSLLCPPERPEAFFWDLSCKGLGVRALRSGRRTWIYQYRDANGRTRRMALGDVSAVSLDAAREAARRAAAAAATGSNPSVNRKKRRSAETILDLINAYLAYAKERQKPRSYKETERHLRLHAAPLHHERGEAVQRRDIAGLLEKVAQRSGSIAANRLRAALSALWSWALRAGLIDSDSNPVAFTPRQPETARDRVLNDAELRAVWAATDDLSDYSRIVRLCLLTGCRRTEIGGLRWDEVQDDRIVIGPARMKGKVAHEIPLLPRISVALPTRPEDAGPCVFGRRGTGFFGFSDGKEKLDAKLAASGLHADRWGLHDLRRTFSTRLHDAGIEPIVIEALLAHKQQGVAAVYNRASFREAKSRALQRWHQLLCEIL